LKGTKPIENKQLINFSNFLHFFVYISPKIDDIDVVVEMKPKQGEKEMDWEFEVMDEMFSDENWDFEELNESDESFEDAMALETEAIMFEDSKEF